jgi:NtrC-family two-component system response regulator AlgB
MIKKILLVDDEEVILNTYATLLGERGYAVVTACCGRQALEEFFSHSFDLVITDLAMSDIDGFTVIEEVKKLSPGTPVIAFTAKCYKNVKEYVSLLGASALLEKTCSIETFITYVNSSLENGCKASNAL